LKLEAIARIKHGGTLEATQHARIGLKEALLRTLNDRPAFPFDLSTQSGINEQSISRYRRNRVDIKASTLGSSTVDGACDRPILLEVKPSRWLTIMMAEGD